MVLSMESISHGLRYMEKPSHHCSWGSKEGTQAGVALVSLLVLGMSRSGTSANLVCAYRNETGLCESPPFVALSIQKQRAGSTITHQEEGLSPCRPFPCLHLCLSHIWCQQHWHCPAWHWPSWMTGQEDRNREGGQRRASRQQHTGSPGTKRHYIPAGAILENCNESCPGL